jgi:hypothetical protein
MTWSDRDEAGLELNAAKKHPPLLATTHWDLIVLTRWMHAEDYDVERILDAAAAPWQWREELAQAKTDLEAAVAAHPAGAL